MKLIKKLVFLLFSFLLFVTPAYAESREWVIDEEGVLSDSEIDSLNEQIDELVDTYEIGIYIRLMQDSDGYDIEDYGEYLYQSEDMGIGEEQSGLLLTMEFYDRNYDILAYGNGNIAFTDYGKEHLEDLMLPSFANDDWYEGFEEYLSGVEMELESYANGTPYDLTAPSYDDRTDENSDFYYEYDYNGSTYSENLSPYVIFIGSPLIALLICIFLASKHRTAKEAVYAQAYVTKGGLNLTRHFDRYTHTTRTVTHIPRNDNHGGGGGTSINSGGFSHSSGKF